MATKDSAKDDKIVTFTPIDSTRCPFCSDTTVQVHKLPANFLVTGIQKIGITIYPTLIEQVTMKKIFEEEIIMREKQIAYSMKRKITNFENSKKDDTEDYKTALERSALEISREKEDYLREVNLAIYGKHEEFSSTKEFMAAAQDYALRAKGFITFDEGSIVTKPCFGRKERNENPVAFSSRNKGMQEFRSRQRNAPAHNRYNMPSRKFKQNEYSKSAFESTMLYSGIDNSSNNLLCIHPQWMQDNNQAQMLQYNQNYQNNSTKLFGLNNPYGFQHHHHYTTNHLMSSIITSNYNANCSLFCYLDCSQVQLNQLNYSKSCQGLNISKPNIENQQLQQSTAFWKKSITVEKSKRILPKFHQKSNKNKNSVLNSPCCSKSVCDSSPNPNQSVSNNSVSSNEDDNNFNNKIMYDTINDLYDQMCNKVKDESEADLDNNVSE